MRAPSRYRHHSWLARRSVIVLACVPLGLLAACGGEDAEPSPPAGSAPKTTRAPATTPAAKSSPNANDVASAERAAKEDLPDIPLYKGARFKGKAQGENKVCVDRTITKSSAALVGGARTSHVVVTLPDLAIGEPKDGPCAKASENADKAIEAAKRFYLRVDDDAIQLDEAVSAVQNETPGAAARLSRVRDRLDKRVTDYLLDSGETSIGGNLLVSAATTAREAAQRGDVARLAKVRKDIAEARAKLADEALK